MTESTDPGAAMPSYDFEVAVSFAGENRSLVLQVVRRLQERGVNVFYDEDQMAATWGADLVEFFDAIYQRRARYAMLFLSQAYVDKKWPKLERRSALARAMSQSAPYVLPVRLDDVEVPGLPSTTGNLDARYVGIDGIVNTMLAKLAADDWQPADVVGKAVHFNGRVPRTAEEVAVILEERPSGWEYTLWIGATALGLSDCESTFRDYELEYSTLPARTVRPENLPTFLGEKANESVAIIERFNRLFSPEAQEAAFGAPGEPGDPDRILHRADRFVQVYKDMLTWSFELFSVVGDNDVVALSHAFGRYFRQGIHEIREKVDELTREFDTLNERLVRGDTVRLETTITVEIPAEVSAAFDQAFHEFKRTHGYR